MEGKENHVGLSPTVLSVFRQFSDSMRDDEGIDSQQIDRLEELLAKGAVPKPE